MKQEQYTDTQLKQALAKMLPEKLIMYSGFLFWKPEHFYTSNELPDDDVLGTELLHLCWLVEETLNPGIICNDNFMTYGENWLWPVYTNYLSTIIRQQEQESNIHATWQQRVMTLAKVKGVEIV